MISIARQGLGSAVVHVPVTDLSNPGAPWQGEGKEEAKQLALTFMTVNSTWSTGRTEVTRATLHADAKHYTVLLRHYTS